MTHKIPNLFSRSSPRHIRSSQLRSMAPYPPTRHQKRTLHASATVPNSSSDTSGTPSQAQSAQQVASVAWRLGSDGGCRGLTPMGKKAVAVSGRKSGTTETAAVKWISRKGYKGWNPGRSCNLNGTDARRKCLTQSLYRLTTTIALPATKNRVPWFRHAGLSLQQDRTGRRGS